MSAPVTVVRRRNRAGLWGWDISPRVGPFAGAQVLLAGQTQLSDVVFVTSTQTKLEGNMEHGQLDMTGSARVEKRGLHWFRADTGELVKTAQGAWLTPLGRVFAVGLE